MGGDGSLTAPRGACAVQRPHVEHAYNVQQQDRHGNLHRMVREGIETPVKLSSEGKMTCTPCTHRSPGRIPFPDLLSPRRSEHPRLRMCRGGPLVTDHPIISPGTISAGDRARLGRQCPGRRSTGLHRRRPASMPSIRTDAAGIALLDITAQVLDTLLGPSHGPGKHPLPRIDRRPAIVDVCRPFGPAAVDDIDGNLDGRLNPNEHCGFPTRSGIGEPSRRRMSAQRSPSRIPPGSTSSRAPGLVRNDCGGRHRDLVALHRPHQARLSRQPHRLAHTFVSPAARRPGTTCSNFHVVGPVLVGERYLINDQGSAQANARSIREGPTVLYFTTGTPGGMPHRTCRTFCGAATRVWWIQDSIGYFGSGRYRIPSTNLADYFVVTVADTCPNNISIPSPWR